MDKYEYKIRADEIRELISEGQYAKAAELADTIDWSRVKKSAVLCTISDLYKKNRRYEDAIELLLLAYERFPGGKDILYSLCELYIKTNNIIKAVATYKEFVQVANADSRRYILQYKIYEMQDISLEERIEVLEELKARDYREKWAYTLAYLYHRVGLATKCVEECDELILWFDEGRYVYKAMELKMLHQPLTKAQQEKYDHRFDALDTGYNQNSIDDSDEYGDENLESQNGNSSYEQISENSYEQISNDQDVEQAALAGNTVAYTPIRDKIAGDVYVTDDKTVVAGGLKGSVSSPETIALSLGHTQVYHGIQEEPEIQVKQVDVGEYNTINLQKALAEGVAQVLENGEPISNNEIIKADTKEIKADTKEILPVIGEENSELSSSDENSNSEKVVKTITDVKPATDLEIDRENIEYKPQSVTDDTVVIAKVSGTFDATKTIPLHDIQSQLRNLDNIEDKEAKEDSIDNAFVEAVRDEITIGEVQSRTEEMYSKDEISEVAARALSAQPPEQLAGVMTQEADGQLSFVMPEDRNILVRQITGQLSISDVMTEWNKMKSEREELNRKRYHEYVKQQTGEIFNEFERAALNGVLETLEKESQESTVKVVKPTLKEYYPTDTIGENDEVEELTEIAEDITPDENLVEGDLVEASDFGEEVFEEVDGEEEAVENYEETFEEEIVEDGEAYEASEEVADDSEAYEIGEEVADDSEAYEIGEEVADDSEAYEIGEEVAGENETYDENPDVAEEEAEVEAEVDPRDKTYHVIGMNDTTNLYISKRNKKLAEKNMAEADADSREESVKTENLREFTPEEKKYFGPYLQNADSQKQLINMLDNVSMASYTGNIILTGGDVSDVSELATTILKYTKQTDSNFSGKVARGPAKSLNNKKIDIIVKQLANGGLIIENASMMSDEAIKNLCKSLDQENHGIIITMLDNERNMEKLLDREPKLLDLFTARMNIKPLTKEELADYAVKYAYEREFSIDQMGMLALHTQIEARQTASHSVNVVEVKEIVDKAIAHVKKKNLAHFFDVLGGKRYDKEDMIILGEKDFN